MEKWSIQPAPSQSDPLRFRLFIKGSMKDISTLLKRFGALCGRPAPENSPEGYNYSLPLHRVGKPAMQRLRAALEEMSAKSRPVAAAPSSPKVAPPAATPPPAPVAAPAAKVPAPKTAAPKGDLFGATQPLDPEQTFETMIVGPYNRFAHAAATSVVGAPGAMYNPLFLHGLPGVGKTHCLQAIGHAFCASLGPDSVVMSSAYRLSKVVSRALAGGGYDRLKPRLLAAKVLIVDSVHLFTVDERNQPALTEILSHFISDGRQLVMSSLYPPRALGALEEALKISLSRGWAVDLKVPNDGARLEIVQSWLDRRGVGFSADDTRAFLERLGDGYPACELWLRRLEALVSLWKAGGKPLNCDDLLNVLFDPGAEAQPPSSKELA
ncbi:MAG: ATP-binding protein, partial [Elusimicrobia bacterium]|nr:ATP-binding protein [Elusimicrobiota bacterium]